MTKPDFSRFDFAVYDAGTLVLLKPLSRRAQKWVREHIPADAMRFGGSIAVERRYLAPILRGIADSGMVIA